jgi:hypothetical protein
MTDAAAKKRSPVKLGIGSFSGTGDKRATRRENLF